MLIGNKRLYGTVVFIVLISMPLLLWLNRIGFAAPFDSPSALLRSIGKASALIGLAAYSLMPILSMRHGFLEKIFGSLDSVYLLHRQSGKVSYFFMLAHPVFLGIGGFVGGKSLTTIWNWSSLVVISGIFALFAITALTILAIYAHIKHQRWVIIHRLFGWMLPLLFAHALLAKSQIVQNRALFVYMLALGSLGALAFLYRSVFGRYVVKKYRYAVAEVNKVGPAVTELVLKPLGIPIVYTPGQFAYLSVESETIDQEAHPYSFTTANNGPYVRFAIKELGDDTGKIKELRPGAKAFLEGPYGKFSLHNAKRMEQVWIAGGVGITPFLSMARSLSPHSKQRVHLFYAADKLDDAVFLKELFAVQKTIPQVFEITIVNKEVSGFVTIEMLTSYLSDPKQFDYLICGPPVMMQKLKAQLMELGVKSPQVHTEEFSML